MAKFGRTFEFEMSLYDDNDREILVLVEMFSGHSGSSYGPMDTSYPAAEPEIRDTEAVWADTKVELTDEEYKKFVKAQEDRIYDYGYEYEKEDREDYPDRDL